MEIVVGVIMVSAVSALIAAPLLRTQSQGVDPAGAESRELWEHEKNIALLAIKEAEFDHATGKLSNDDYDTLRAGYERRASDAIENLGDGKTAATATSQEPGAARPALFCPACGIRFGQDDRFCTGCGCARASLD